MDMMPSVIENVTTAVAKIACADLHHLNSTLELCPFVKDHCIYNMGFIEYLDIVYCGIGVEKIALGIFLSLVWLLILFIGLGLTSSEFLTPALFKISKTLNMSQNMAGVTLLAFGNGSPDIFSALAGIRQGSYELVIGGLVGGGIFVTTVVVGSVFVASSFKIAMRPFLRDVAFYLSAAIWAFLLFYYERIQIRDSLCFIFLYVCYIGVVVVSGVVYQKYMVKTDEETPNEKAGLDEAMPKPNYKIVVPSWFRKQITEILDDPQASYVTPMAFRYFDAEEIVQQEAQRQLYMQQEMNSCYTISDNYEVVAQPSMEKLPIKSAYDEPLEMNAFDILKQVGLKVVGLEASIDDDEEENANKNSVLKIVSYFKMPFYILMSLTIAVVDPKKPQNNWCRVLNSLHCITTPVFLTVAFGMSNVKIGGVLNVPIFIAIFGLIAALVVFFTSKNEIAPKYHWVFAYLGFLGGVTWIYLISMEVVVMLQAIGVIFNISDVILGLTILTWGNSLLDFVANVNVARKGFPRISFSACFGTPCLTLLLGVGIPSLIMIKETAGPLTLKFTPVIPVLFAALATSMLSTLIIMLVTRGMTSRIHGAYLIVLYFSFLFLAVTVESGIIHLF